MIIFLFFERCFIYKQYKVVNKMVRLIIKDKINISRYKKLYRQKTCLIVKIKIVIDNYDNICYCNAV